MNDLSPMTKSLLRAAREDGPSAGSRARIWDGVALTAAGGSAVGAAVAGKTAASAGTAKILFVTGALLGSAITVGVAAMALHVGAPRLHSEPAVVVRADPESAAIAPAASPLQALPPSALPASNPPPAAATEATASRRAKVRAHSVEDSLAREAELVAEARGAIVRGEPTVALNALHAAQALPGHALEPEELSLEVRALRAKGDLDGANAAEARLRAKYPDNALAR
jgi:ribonuclease E